MMAVSIVPTDAGKLCRSTHESVAVKDLQVLVNPNAYVGPTKIKELSKTLSSKKVAKILGIAQKTVLRHLRGELARERLPNRRRRLWDRWTVVG